MSEQIIRISRDEQNFIWRGVQRLLPGLAAAKEKKFFVGTPEDSEYWRDIIESMLIEEHRRRVAVANGREEPNEGERKMPPRQLVDRTSQSAGDIEWFRSEIERFREEARARATARAEREAEGTVTSDPNRPWGNAAAQA